MEGGVFNYLEFVIMNVFVFIYFDNIKELVLIVDVSIKNFGVVII